MLAPSAHRAPSRPVTPSAPEENSAGEQKYPSPKEQLKIPMKWKSPQDFAQLPLVYQSPNDQLKEHLTKEECNEPNDLQTQQQFPPLLSDSEEENEKGALPQNVQSQKTMGGGGCRPPNKSASWTLPPCGVTVTPRSPARFWQLVRQKAATEGDWDLVERLEVPHTITIPAQTCSLMNVSDDSNEREPMVEKAAPGTDQQDNHQVLGWKVVQDLRSTVVKYGVNSSETMQLLRVIDTDLLCPFDIKHIAQVIFQPVQFSVFESNWKKLAEKAAIQNMQRAQGNPLLGVGVDALMGMGAVFSNPNTQAHWHPLILEQSQRIGMTAIRKTMEIASPCPCYTVIKQGPREPFLQFVEKISAAIEKQVDDEGLRQILCRQLAKDNANEDCQKIIDALPGEPSIADMVTACSKVGTTDFKMASLAAALRSKGPKKCFNCGKEGHLRANCQNGKAQLGANLGSFLCNRCGKSGHFAKQCRSKFHANGQPIQGNGKKNARRRVMTRVPHNLAAAPPDLQVPPYVTGSQAKQGDQQGWMHAQQV
ncbi:endogenous retrovirus group K member 113 Gag polyprotein-like [Indicator indicator]|uniref:endogenous retrovirus group K member 113 Gag polyprotein-like n=1 Tax=Indicator indicator TaxID=1002788 RepID=UPI0023DFB433|nr:endogenous retrovirus group K member 113 Gag polyprotein-like [Indicator indicator]